MARKKKDKEKKTSPDTQSHHSVANEIWGIVFTALATLIVIALVSFHIDPNDNILGSKFAALAKGLIVIFGTIPSFMVPGAVFIFGLSNFKGSRIALRALGIWVILMLELSLLLSIHDIPAMVAQSRIFKPNFVGHTLAFVLHYVFGAHRFGPYFLAILTVVITLVLSFRINVRAMAAIVWNALRIGWDKTAGALAALGARLKSAREARRELAPAMATAGAAPSAPAAPAAPPPQAQEEAPAQESKQSQEQKTEDEQNVEKLARKQLEEELKAFRARKNEPVKITVVAEDDGDSPEGNPDDDVSAITLPQESGEQADGEVEEIVADEDSEAEDSEGVPIEEADVTPREEEEDEEDEEEAEDPSDDSFKPRKPKAPPKPYKIPSPDVLSDPPTEAGMYDRSFIETNSSVLEKTLMNFGVEGKVVNVSPGPVINRYEIELAPGIKVSKVMGLQDDIAMAVGGQKIRMQAPIPGKAAIGVELPNPQRQIVHFKHVLLSDAFRKSKAKLPIIIGKTISGGPYVSDITRMPHLLIAGQTGSGKSVCINCLIASLLMTKTPDELRMIMIDPKKVELASFQGIPHLLSPVVTESKEAVKALQWGVIEMERRYRLLAKVGARNIESFNNRLSQGRVREGAIPDEDNKPLPFIVILVDELADLMMTASRDVEGLVQRIAQLARAVGIHLIVSTQRPSVDIITGPIKANLTSRIGFRTIQATDSRTILGHVGAEKLLGMGDMLFLRNGAPDLERYHGAFMTEEDVESLVSSIREQYVDVDTIESFEEATSEAPPIPGVVDSADGDDQRDELFGEAAQTIVSIGQGSTSLLQRRLKIGYARAGRLMDQLEQAGIVGPQEGSKVRDVLVKSEELPGILKSA